ncbi:hypothetical protein FA13DRAFT_1741238 [Coprinellus micaceus]|uniref:Uncharacterized protein n=1 Tax=Coprinellus micaceus TaxID=71717 RepID=A0A4Y7SKN4_COPMI|nr:hypothetical protein FA13DRAFT_1741238 [Coprinellus micaceus]
MTDIYPGSVDGRPRMPPPIDYERLSGPEKLPSSRKLEGVWRELAMGIRTWTSDVDPYQ